MGIIVTSNEAGHPTGLALPSAGDTYIYPVGDAWYSIDSAGTQTLLGLSGGQSAVIASALQPGDNISELTNNANFQTAGQLTNAITTNNLLREPYETYSNGTPVVIGAGYTLIPMGNQVDAVTGYSQSGGVITVAIAGSYTYEYTVSADSTDGDRSTVQAAIFVAGAELVRSKSFAYCRSVANGEDTATKTGKLILTAGQVVSVRALLIGDNAQTVPNASNLVLRRVK